MKRKETPITGLEIYCDSCRQLLGTPGALVFSPPDKKTGLVKKLHLCTQCWGFVYEDICG